VNADDLGMSKSVNDAIFRAIREGVVRSTSLMVPGPEAREAMRRLRDDPVLLSYAPLQEVWAAHGNLARRLQGWSSSQPVAQHANLSDGCEPPPG
jgi:hypothetical protein